MTTSINEMVEVSAARPLVASRPRRLDGVAATLRKTRRAFMPAFALEASLQWHRGVPWRCFVENLPSGLLRRRYVLLGPVAVDDFFHEVEGGVVVAVGGFEADAAVGLHQVEEAVGRF